MPKAGDDSRARDLPPSDLPPSPSVRPVEVPALSLRPESFRHADRHLLAERLASVESLVGNREQLRGRLLSLEPGHPSSPWDERGELRPPVLRLTDIERPAPPLSDEAYAAHRADVAVTLDLAEDAGFTTKDLFAIDNDGRAWVTERRAIHDEIIWDTYAAAADVRCDGLAVIAGGLYGAGKTTVLDGHAGIDRSALLVLDPDRFKEELARRGLTPDISGLSPMEASSLAHVESSHITRQLAGRALADGKNVLWDVSLSSERSAVWRLSELQAAGYQDVAGIFVDIGIPTSVARASARHRLGHDQYLAGEGFGGRFLSDSSILAQADLDYGSINRRAFEGIKGQLSYWAIYDNSVDGQPPTLTGEGGREERWPGLMRSDLMRSDLMRPDLMQPDLMLRGEHDER
jgi:hypothetical protein